MSISIISSLFFFAVAAILRTEQLRTIPLSRPLTYYFLMEAVWTLLAGLLALIWSYTAIWSLYVHYILLAVVAVYLFYCCCVLFRSRKDSGPDAPVPDPKISDLFRAVKRRYQARKAKKEQEKAAGKE